MTLSSIARVEKMAIDRILMPHHGVLDAEKTAFYLSTCRKSAEETAQRILQILQSGGTREDAVQYFRDTFYRGGIPAIYPEDAMLLNTGIMIGLIESELGGGV